MVITKQEVHRPGSLKQTNKQHKTGRHRSKGSISSEVKGRVGVKALTKRLKKDLGRDARRHQSSQIRKKKRDEVLAQKRNLGGSHSAPILICMIPLQEDLEVQHILAALTKADETAIVANSPSGVTHISLPRFKQRFSVIIPPVGNLFATLDAAKVATTILFVTSAANRMDSSPRHDVIDDWGREIIVPCLAQGLATTIVAATNIDCLHVKKRQDHKHHVQEVVSKWLPEEKVFQLDSASDCLNILRRAGSQKQKAVSYRNRRAHLVAEEVQFACNPDSTELGTLKVSGYLRDAPLSVNSLIHIPGLGDFQMSQIDAPEDPYPMEKKKRSNTDEAMEEEGTIRVLERADPNKQESLQSENIPDPMDAEQTWPTEEELAQAAAAQKKKIVKLVPKGTSEYQAAWIPDEDGEDASESSDNEEDGMSMDEAKSQDDSGEEAEEDEYETLTVSEAAPDEQRYDQDVDMDEEKRAREKLKEAKLDAQFPDEVDTPDDVLAKIRFQKYRGLESFRTSPWDPKENLPIDYARIFQFENFERTRKRIFKESQETDGALPGWYITIHVKDVRRELFTAFSALENRPLIVFGLLQNEQKMSLLNVVLKHANQDIEPVKSKERLVFQCGFRRFSACPVFSQHTNGTKHKYERYFQPESTIVASMYAPIVFPPCPVLCYIEKSNGLELVGTGSVLSANPDRMVIKRAVLSGHPYKVNKRSAVIRFMFFHREDIKWFKPVQLRTKYGRRGHIKEPLGTHGHMKCVFNGQLKSQDTILMNLYKRVFPKWTFEPLLVIDTQRESETMNVE